MKITNRFWAILFGVLLTVALVYFFSSIVMYVAIAWVLSMIGQPLMRFFQRFRYKRLKIGPNMAAVLVLLTYFVVVGVLFITFVPLIVTEAQHLADVDYSSIAQALEEPLGQFNNWLAQYGIVEDAPSAEEQLQNALRLQDWFKPELIGNLFTRLLSTAGNIFMGVFSVVFITFFFLREQGMFTNFLVAIFPNRHEAHIRNAIDDISRLLTRYFGGILVQMTIITIFVWLGLSIFGVKNALLIGVFAALINVIPYLGPIIGAAFGIFITISSNLQLDFYSELLPLITQVAIVFALMQLLDNFILQPWIFSNSVLAHPLEIFIVVLMGAQIGGVVGMVLAIPGYTVLRVIAASFLSEFKIVQSLTKGMDLEEEE